MNSPDGRAYADAHVFFETSYRTHWGQWVRFAMCFVGDEGRAEDIVQKVVVKVLSSGTFSNIKNPASYVFSAIHNACLNFLRDEALRSQIMHSRLDPSAAPTVDPESHFFVGEMLRRVELAIAGLTEGHREIVTLCVEGASPADMATQLNIAPGTVASRLARARSQLRAALSSGVPDNTRGELSPLASWEKFLQDTNLFPAIVFYLTRLRGLSLSACGEIFGVSSSAIFQQIRRLVAPSSPELAALSDSDLQSLTDVLVSRCNEYLALDSNEFTGRKAREVQLLEYQRGRVRLFLAWLSKNPFRLCASTRPAIF